MLAHHRGLGITVVQRFRFASLLSLAADDAGLPDDAEFRSAFVAYVEWGTRIALHNSQPGAEVIPACSGAALGLGRSAAVSRLTTATFARCVKNALEMGAITQLVAGVPVSDLDVGIDWYTRFFGRPPDMRVGDEVLWDIDEHATLFIEPNAEQAGAGRITFRRWARRAARAPRCPAHRARPDRDLLERRPPRECSRSGWEQNRLRRAARRGERVASTRYPAGLLCPEAWHRRREP